MSAKRTIQAEQGVIDSFRDYYKETARCRGSNGRSFSVGARDRLVAGDYIFVADSCFTLVEFKWSKGSFKAERAKSIANLLCRELSSNEAMRELAQRCHRIAWKSGPRVEVGAYFDVVCCDKSGGAVARDFCQQWFDPPPPHRVNYEDFQTYVNWLVELSGASKSDLLMIGGNHVEDGADLPDLFLGEFYGLAELKAWLDENEPPPPRASVNCSPHSGP